jgi:uncharacterized RDD family membrane protein YckC
MTCPRCSYKNSEETHRCGRCMARLTSARMASALYGPGSTALQMEPETATAVAEVPAPRLEVTNERPVERALPRHAGSTQQSLFAARDTGRVVSISGEEFRTPQVRRTAERTRAKRKPQQGVLEFVPAQGPSPRRLATSVEAVIYCEHTVASTSHRILAAGYDFCLYMGLLAAFAGVIFYGCQGLAEALGKPVVMGVLGAAAALLAIVYEWLFLVGCGATPGMRWAGLRLVNFDGRRPAGKQLWMRAAGGAVSLLPVGMGLVWAWLDEEELTWQDHMSHTFPTPWRG